MKKKPTKARKAVRHGPSGAVRVVTGAFDAGSFDSDALDTSRTDGVEAGSTKPVVSDSGAGAESVPPVGSINQSHELTIERLGGAKVQLDAPVNVTARSHAPIIQAGLPKARTTLGRAVLVNFQSLEITGLSLVILLDAHIGELRRQNTDEAQEALAQYRDLKTKVEAFLAAAAEFTAGKTEEQALVKSKMSFADGVRDIWEKRHLKMADVGLLGVALGMCHLADPVSVVVAGAIVGGNKVVDAIKAAAELAKRTK